MTSPSSSPDPSGENRSGENRSGENRSGGDRPRSGDRHRLTFCPDCGTAGDGRDTCPTCARTLSSPERQLSPTGLAAALAEAVAVGAAGRLGRGYRWVRGDRRRFLVARFGAAAGLVAVVAGASFGLGAASTSGEDGHDRASISAEHQDGAEHGDHGRPGDH